MKTQIITILIALSFGNIALAKVSSRWKPLVDANIQCTVVKAQSFKNGEARYIFNSQKPQLETLVQDGGAEFEDAKCFLAAATTKSGEKAAIGHCFSINDQTVKEFSANRLGLSSKDGLITALNIDFRTGKGSFSKTFSGCDRGRKCVDLYESFDVVNCTLN